MSSTQIRAIVGAEVVSSIGSSMTVLALPWFVLVTTGSATKLGIVLGIGSIPFVTLPVLAGSLIARIGARQTMVIADAARLPLFAAIPALYSLHALPFPLLVVLVALTNVFTAAHMPAQRLILAEVVGDEESVLARVNAYLDGAQTTASLVGPALAGVLIAALGAPNVLYVDAATFGVAAIVVGLFVPRRKPMAEAEQRGLLAGVRYVLRSRLLVVLCVSTLTMEFFFALFLLTLPVFAYSDYGRTPALQVSSSPRWVSERCSACPSCRWSCVGSGRSRSAQPDSCSRRSQSCCSEFLCLRQGSPQCWSCRGSSHL
ncbi:MAG TPA: MFS transporter [Acidimicrobiia bacterium]|nr:MFS transporter [Acidimicrobiia bacterium]